MEILPLPLVENISKLLDLDDTMALSQASRRLQWLAPSYSRLTYQHVGLSTFELRLEKKPKRVEIKVVDREMVKTTQSWSVKVDENSQMISFEPKLMWFVAGDGRVEASLEQGGGDIFLRGEVRCYSSEMTIEVNVIFHP